MARRVKTCVELYSGRIVFSSLTSRVSKLERIAVKLQLETHVQGAEGPHKSSAAISVGSCSDSARAAIAKCREIGRRVALRADSYKLDLSCLIVHDVEWMLNSRTRISKNNGWRVRTESELGRRRVVAGRKRIDAYVAEVAFLVSLVLPPAF